MGRDLLPAENRDKEYQPIKWTGTHRKIIALEAAGYRPSEIAKMMDISISRVSVILNDPRADLDRRDFADKVVNRVQDMQLRFAQHAEEALEEIVDLMRHSNSDKVRQTSAFGILDRAGYSPVKKQLTVDATIPPDVAGAMRETLEEMKAIDADYEIVQEDDESA